jgi:hypothetical protein
VAVALIVCAASNAHAQGSYPILQFKAPAIWCTLGGTPVDQCQPYDPNEPDQSGSAAGVDAADILGPGVGEPLDGKPEVAVANETDTSITVFRNTGDWSPPTDGLEIHAIYDMPSGVGAPYDLQFADMNGDFDPDIVVSAGNAIVVFLNDGSGAFPTSVIVPVHQDTAAIYGIVAADLDFDGQQEIVASGSFIDGTRPKPQVEVIWNPMSSTNRRSKVVKVNSVFEVGQGSGFEVVAAQVDFLTTWPPPPPPNHLDLIMSMEAESDKVFVLLYSGADDTDGDAIWNASVYDAADSYGLDYGKLRNTLPGPARDMVLSDNVAADGFMEVFYGNGFGTLTFNAEYDAAPITRQRAMQIASLDYDTAADVAIAGQYGWPPTYEGALVVFQGKGNGTFNPPRHFRLYPEGIQHSAWPAFLKVANLDGVGFNDVVLSTTKKATIVVLINNTAIPE